MQSDIKNVAVIGNYLPRKCGIATFTTDLCEALAGRFKKTTVQAFPINDREEGYAYPPRVRFEVAEQDLTSYHSVAEFLGIHDLDIVSLQHEYGIFGGTDGSHVLTLLRELDIPIVTTLHTVLHEPTDGQRRVLEELTLLTDRFIVMSKRGAEFLKNLYGVPAEMIDFVHHGIPDVPFVDPNYYKPQFDVAGKTVLLTFGLLSPSKGVEYVINAMPEIIKRYPNVVYLIQGATHPNLLEREGESYRESLEGLAESLGVRENVIFRNSFISLDELNEYIGAADIYITPYLNETQITSGTLAYALGAGKAIISTPYWYAEELLSEGRGLIVPFRDSDAIALNVVRLLDGDAERHGMRKAAYSLGREMIWSTVAERYMESFYQAIEDRFVRPRVIFGAKTFNKREGDLPALKLDHLSRMTDGTGVLQHARFAVPNYTEGYCTDDNARALILSVLVNDLDDEFESTGRLAEARYLAFLNNAYNAESGRFRNFMTYARQWAEDVGSEDSHGRAIWALGMVACRSRERGVRDMATQLLEWALPITLAFTSPRAWAFSILGAVQYLHRFEGHRAVQHVTETLAERLLDYYGRTSAKDWLWYEDVLAYANAKLPHALLIAGEWLSRDDMLETGLASLGWLADVQRMEGDHFVPIGSNGFYHRGGSRARFDQQPIDAHASVSASLAAYRITRDDRWKTEGLRAFDWFMGRNDLGVPLYDPKTGGCFDGLHPCRVNHNQGAESTLAFLLSLAEIRYAQQLVGAADTKREATPFTQGSFVQLHTARAVGSLSARTSTSHGETSPEAMPPSSGMGR